VRAATCFSSLETTDVRVKLQGAARAHYFVSLFALHNPVHLAFQLRRHILMQASHARICASLSLGWRVGETIDPEGKVTPSVVYPVLGFPNVGRMHLIGAELTSGYSTMAPLPCDDASSDDCSLTGGFQSAAASNTGSVYLASSLLLARGMQALKMSKPSRSHAAKRFDPSASRSQ